MNKEVINLVKKMQTTLDQRLCEHEWGAVESDDALDQYRIAEHPVGNAKIRLIETCEKCGLKREVVFNIELHCD